MQKDFSNDDEKSPRGQSGLKRWRRLVPFGGGAKSVSDSSGDVGEGTSPQEGSHDLSSDSTGSREGLGSSASRGDLLLRRGVGQNFVAKVRGMRSVDNAQSRKLRRLRRAAEGGDIEAMCELGDALERGTDGVEKDIRKAVEWYERAISEGGHTRATFRLACILHKGVDGMEKDVPKAALLYEKAICEREEVNAMISLGKILQEGEGGMEQDKKRAVELYERAIALVDDEWAMIGLAVLLETDDGDVRDVRRAVDLYERAVEKGNCMAMSKLALMLEYGLGGKEADIPRAMRLYERAIVEREDVNSMRNLGRILVDGKGGTEKDVERGAELLERAMKMYERSIAENGDVASMIGLAWILQFGVDHMRDLGRSVELYERAIEEFGDVESMVNLAVMLMNGRVGIDRDVKRAVALYEKAIAKGHEQAMSDLGHTLLWGVEGLEGEDGIEKDVERGLSLLERSVAKGNSSAMCVLGFALVYGPDEVKKDAFRAVELFERAMKGGRSFGLINLAFVLWRGIGGVRRDSRRALQLLEGAVGQRKIVAMRHLAEVLRVGDDHIRRDVPRAVKLLEEALSASTDWRERAICSVALARLLLSEEAGPCRDPHRARGLLESAKDTKFGPVYHELGSLLRRGDDGVEQEKERGEELLMLAKKCERYDVRYCAFVCDPCTRYLLDAGEELEVIVEETMRVAKCKPRLCFTLVMGGAGRGKTSIVRSLQRASFLEEHEPTEFVSLNRMGILRGGGIASDEEFRDMEFACESLMANMSRAKGVVEVQAEGRGSGGGSEKEVEEGQESEGSGEEGGGSERSGSSGAEDGEGASARARKRDDESNGGDGRDEGNIWSGGVEIEGSSGRAEDGAWKCNALCEEDEDREKSREAQRAEEAERLAERRERKARVLERGRLALTEQSAIPKSEHAALLRCWDLGGQTQYVMAHALFIGYASILVFVVDLERFDRQETQEEEVKELCRWMQMAHCLCHDPKSVHAIIVGTRKGSCVDVEGSMKGLKEKLLVELGVAVYDDWVGRGGRAGIKEEWPVFLGIENSISVEDPVGSGLADLEGVVWSMAEEVVAKREEVMARWVAFMEELERSKRVMFWKRDIDDFVRDFPGFDGNKEIREKDALCALQYFRTLGRIVLFEEDDGEYCVFADPGKIVEFVRKVTGPEEIMIDRLGKEAGLELKRGILTRKGLSVLWGEYDDGVQEVMLKLLCKFDLLMQIECNEEGGCGEYLIGVPALLPEGREGFRWKLCEGHREVMVRTRFDDALPPGLSGCVIAHLHRTVGAKKTPRDLLRSNGAILSLGGACRVAVLFYPEGREVKWVIRGEAPIGIAHECLRGLGSFLDGPLRKGGWKRKNHLVFDCAEEKGGCGGRASVLFEIGEKWIGDGVCGDVRGFEGECLDGQPWSLGELVPLRVGGEDMVERPLEVREAYTRYDVFISHAGAEKYTVAYPLRKELEKLGWRSFLDEESLKPSDKTNEEQIRAAIRGSRIGMFILSPSFVSRKWPMLEVKLFFDEMDEAVKRGEEKPVLFPLFYKLSVEECGDRNLALRREYEEIFEESGFFSESRQPVFSTAEVMCLLKRLKGFVGIRNDLGETEKEFVGRAASMLDGTFRRKEE